MNRLNSEVPLHFVALDDMELLLKLFHRVIENLGHTAEITTDPEEALDKLRNPKVNGLFLDYEMGATNGVIVARRARSEILYKGPIVMITANLGIEDIDKDGTEPDIRQSVKEGLLLDVIKKPYRREDLQRAIMKMQNFRM